MTSVLACILLIFILKMIWGGVKISVNGTTYLIKLLDND